MCSFRSFHQHFVYDINLHSYMHEYVAATCISVCKYTFTFVNVISNWKLR